MLSNLGRREDALAASQEAVDIRRRLAELRPDAFLPDLARSLGTLGQTLATAERHAEAAAAAREGLAAIEPLAARHLDAFGGLARALGRDHLEACERAGIEPDTELLGRVARALGAGDADDPAIAALKRKIGAIVAAAEATGTLDEASLADLPAELAQRLREAWAGRETAPP